VRIFDIKNKNGGEIKMARKTVRNEIYSDEKWALVSKENKELLNEFIEYLQSTDKSPTTIYAYTDDIKICWIWNLENNDNKFFVDFTKRDIMKYQSYMLNTMKLSSNRIRRLKATISSLSNFIESMLDDVYNGFRNIVNKIPAPVKQAVREKTILSEEQVNQLLTYLVDNKKYQQACVVALAACSGSRKSELLRFKVSYFVPENIMYGSIYKTPERIKTKGRSSKGKLIFRYVLVDRFQPYLDLWLKEREELGITNEELFVVKNGTTWQPAKVSTLDSWTELFTKVLETDIYFHSFRHHFTTYLSESNIPADVIKSLVGWESVEMVSLYTDTEADEEFGKYFDADGIKQVEQKSIGDLK
jgi:integrase